MLIITTGDTQNCVGVVYTQQAGHRGHAERPADCTCAVIGRLRTMTLIFGSTGAMLRRSAPPELQGTGTPRCSINGMCGFLSIAHLTAAARLYIALLMACSGSDGVRSNSPSSLAMSSSSRAVRSPIALSYMFLTTQRDPLHLVQFYGCYQKRRIVFVVLEHDVRDSCK